MNVKLESNDIKIIHSAQFIAFSSAFIELLNSELNYRLRRIVSNFSPITHNYFDKKFTFEIFLYLKGHKYKLFTINFKFYEKVFLQQ
jgi:hypothetical protein